MNTICSHEGSRDDAVVVRFPDARHLSVEFVVALVLVLPPGATFLNSNSTWRLFSIIALRLNTLTLK